MSDQTLPYPLLYLEYQGKQWEYISAGRGSVFVILPGGGETAESNFRLIRSLAKQYKVIVPTIYDVDSIDEFNAALNSILIKEKANKIILYGLSLGGLLALTYARDNKEKISTLILSHACTPHSKTYKRKIIVPLKILNVLLPLIPERLIQFMTKFAGRAQGQNKESIKKHLVKLSDQDKRFYQLIRNNYYKNFFNKRLLKTWIKLHVEFSKQNLQPENYTYLRKVLILRTDNDPLMQDEGDFQNLYPMAQVHTFKDTGHLTFYYQLESLVEVIHRFLIH